VEIDVAVERDFQFLIQIIERGDVEALLPWLEWAFLTAIARKQESRL